MGDKEIMMAETSVDYKNEHVTNACDTSGSIVHAIENTTAPAPAPAAMFNTSEMVPSAIGNVEGVPVNCQQTSSVMAYSVDENFVAPESAFESAQGADYDSSLNSNGLREAGEGALTNTSENGAAPAGGLSAEEERLWSIVTANSLEFSAWTALIEETERTSEGNIVKIRKVYDTFLAEFPLCYGYWKKYADHEARLSSMDKVVEVYERAVQGVTYSVDMWLNYFVFVIGTYGDPETIRRLFERAIAYVGTDYLCFPLWDKYIEYEISQQDWPRVATIYTRVLEIPNQQLDRYFEGFKELVASRPLSELQTSEDAAAESGADSEAASHKNEGEALPDDTEQSTKAVKASLKDAEELEKYISIREEIYKKAKDVDSKIIGFETAIRRPYFHVRPLNVVELDNWHNYLNFIEGGGDLNKVVKLYERCLIACANYPEYWMRYVLCMEASGSMELAENALARATQVFVKRQPEIHLFAARFKEQHSDISGARGAYHLVHTGIAPGLVEAIIKHANMEHRLGNLEDACSLYEQAIAIEKGKEQSQTLPLLFAQYSRFVYLVSGNVDKARQILVEGVESAQLSKPLIEAMIYLESIQPHPKQIEHIDFLVGKYILPNSENPSVPSIDEREELSTIFLEFLDLFGDAQSIKKADGRHAKLFLHHKSTEESRKRRAEDYLASDRMKQAKSHPYTGATNQWAGVYAAQPQAWPQASQTPAQHWNPAYTQQAAYGVYGSYGANYTHQQVPAAAPHAGAAYGTYPTTYPAQQVIPQQQAYLQPAAATLTLQQPVASATAMYYGSYY